MENNYQGNYQQPLNQQPLNRQQLLQQQRMEHDSQVRTQKSGVTERPMPARPVSRPASGIASTAKKTENVSAVKPAKEAVYSEREKPMTTLAWLGTFVVLAVPFVNIFMLFFWGFGKGNASRSNYCKAFMIAFVLFVTLVFGIAYYILTVVLNIDISHLMEMFK